MPQRTDIHKVLIIGSGPIVIGQACEFDYSGTQACKALRSLGYEIVLVNSNPATIMTDPEMADRTYIEPLNVDRVTQIIKKERPDALLPNLGGQSGLNLCAELYKEGVLDKYNVKVIGVQADAIERGEDSARLRELPQPLAERFEPPYARPRAAVEDMAPAAVQTKHSVEENTTSPPAVSTHAEIASPGTPSRSPIITTFLPAKVLIFHSFLISIKPIYIANAYWQRVVALREIYVLDVLLDEGFDVLDGGVFLDELLNLRNLLLGHGVEMREVEA